ncbi:hypothetical protein ES703_90681 [subsurface metagenome]
MGNKGWYERGRTKAAFDQQPIEVASTVMMLRAAYDATQDKRFLTLKRKAFDWFLGENDLHIPVYDFRTKGSCDALIPGGVNVNQGAESTLSFLSSLLAIVESYAIVEKVEETKAVSLPRSAGFKRPVPIKSIPGKKEGKKKQVEEPA